jgi:uncharacterized protein
VLVDEIVAGPRPQDRPRRGQGADLQAWHWFGNGKMRSHKRQIEDALHRFEKFQLATD